MCPDASAVNCFDFNPDNPYPLIPIVETFKMAARDHARLVDDWLGFNISAAENSLRHRGQAELRPELETWAHLNPQIFLTTYLELRVILDRLALKPGDHVVDLGSGYARLPFVIDRHHEGVSFTGVEAVSERVTESLRVMRKHSVQGTVICQDLCDACFRLPKASVYFLYDFGTESDLRKFFNNWAPTLSQNCCKLVIRGARARHLMEHEWPWIWLNATEHHQNLSIFDLGSPQKFV